MSFIYDMILNKTLFLLISCSYNIGSDKVVKTYKNSETLIKNVEKPPPITPKYAFQGIQQNIIQQYHVETSFSYVN